MKSLISWTVGCLEGVDGSFLSEKRREDDGPLEGADLKLEGCCEFFSVICTSLWFTEEVSILF